MRGSGNYLLNSASAAAIIFALASPTPALAQATPDTATPADQGQATGTTGSTVVSDQAIAPKEEAKRPNEIVVTGTRLRQANLQSKSPITSVTDQEVKLEGATNIENVLNRL